jgi:hypothetical protein
MEEFRQTVSTIFVGSFNLNGSHLSPLESLRWLQTKRRSGQNRDCSFNDTKSVTATATATGSNCAIVNAHDHDRHNTSTDNGPSAYESDFVILSLQECPTAPPCTALCAFNRTNNRNELPLIRVLSSSSCRCCRHDRTFAAKTENNNDSVQRNIQAALSKEHRLVADIAMGEPPSTDTIKPKWYGYIRLVIFAKQEILVKLRMIAHGRNCPAIIPILAPAGRKADDSSQYNYVRNRSPDKGGVCVFFPIFDLLVCSLHLCGTNTYNVPEAFFDAIRIKELNIVLEKCQETIGMNRITCNVVLCGDLNFRVEVLKDAKDKSRGGQDYQIVHDVMRRGDAEGIQKVFWKHDRLLRFLKLLEKHHHHQQELEEQEDGQLLNLLGVNQRYLLLNLRDAFEEYMMGHHMQGGNVVGNEDKTIIYPTFPLQVVDMQCHTAMPSTNFDGSCSAMLESWDGPTYSDKRTPSWTDRILLSETFLRNGYRVKVCGADHKLDSRSDHAPVYAIFVVSKTAS